MNALTDIRPRLHGRLTRLAMPDIVDHGTLRTGPAPDATHENEFETDEGLILLVRFDATVEREHGGHPDGPWRELGRRVSVRIAAARVGMAWADRDGVRAMLTRDEWARLANQCEAYALTWGA